MVPSLLARSTNRSECGDTTVGGPLSTSTRTNVTRLSTSTRTNTNSAIYEPRRSNRVGKNSVSHDGDCWQEGLAVCEAAGNKLVIRSYFKNIRSGKKAWDEPPTGASLIQSASPDMRRQAELQLEELQAALDNTGRQNTTTTTSKHKKGGGLFRRNNPPRTVQRGDDNRTNNNNHSNSGSSSSNNNNRNKKHHQKNSTSAVSNTSTVQSGTGARRENNGRNNNNNYNNNNTSSSRNNNNNNTAGGKKNKSKMKSLISTIRNPKKEQQAREQDERRQREKKEARHLERAIALSLEQSSENCHARVTGNTNYDDEELQLAMMLSISEVAAQTEVEVVEEEESKIATSAETEEEILKRVLKESCVNRPTNGSSSVQSIYSSSKPTSLPRRPSKGGSGGNDANEGAMNCNLGTRTRTMLNESAPRNINPFDDHFDDKYSKPFGAMRPHAHSRLQAQPQAHAHAHAHAYAYAHAHAPAQAHAQAHARTQERSKPEAKPQAKPEIQPQAQLQAQLQAQAQAQAQANPHPYPHPYPHPHPQPQQSQLQEQTTALSQSTSGSVQPLPSQARVSDYLHSRQSLITRTSPSQRKEAILSPAPPKSLEIYDYFSKGATPSPGLVSLSSTDSMSASDGVPQTIIFDDTELQFQHQQLQQQQQRREHARKGASVRQYSKKSLQNRASVM